MLNFKDEPDRKVGTSLQPNEEVRYTIYTSEEQQLHFAGYLCSVWTKRITTDEYFFGGHDTVKTTIPRNIYGSDCSSMHKTLDCYGNQMQRVGKEWRFEKEPEPVAQWMTTQVVDIQNCIITQEELIQECEGCPILSPIGTLGNDTRVAEATRNHVTIVWDNTLIKRKQNCEVIEIENGIGHLFNSTKDQIYRIQDNRRQLEFWAVQPVTRPWDKHHLLQLTMDKKLFISIQLTGGPVLNDKHYQDETTFGDTQVLNDYDIRRLEKYADILVEYLGAAAHIQYTPHIVRLRENALAEEIEALACEMRHNKHLATISTA